MFWVCLFLGVSSPAAEQKIYAPDFTLEDLQGNRVSLSDFKGKVVVLDFWATWCKPCVMEMPMLDKFYTEYKNQGLEVIGVTLDRNPEVVSRFVEKLGVNYLILMGDPAIARIYKAQAIPTTYLLDRSHLIRFGHVGFHPIKTAWMMEKEITTLLAEKVGEIQKQMDEEVREQRKKETREQEHKEIRRQEPREISAPLESRGPEETVAEKDMRKNLMVIIFVIIGLGIFIWLKSRKPKSKKLEQRKR